MQAIFEEIEPHLLERLAHPYTEMTDYLDRFGAGIVFENHDVFNFDYVPNQVVGRDQIQRQLASKFSTIAQPEGSGRAVITGPCLLYTSPSPRDQRGSRMPSSA